MADQVKRAKMVGRPGRVAGRPVQVAGRSGQKGQGGRPPPRMKPKKLAFQFRKPCIKIPPVQKVMPVLVKPRRFGPTGVMPYFNQPYLPRLELALGDS